MTKTVTFTPARLRRIKLALDEQRRRYKTLSDFFSRPPCYDNDFALYAAEVVAEIDEILQELDNRDS